MNATRTLQLALAAIALVASSACGTTSTENSGPMAVPGNAAAVATTVSDRASDTATPTTAPGLPTPTSTTPPTTALPEPEPSSEPLPDPALEPTTAPCGEFGPIPPRPDSMPTIMLDTDGDGTADDEVTAYGAEDGWRLRVVEDEVTSEAVLPGVTGWAFVDGLVVADGLIRVVDVDADLTYGLATDDQRCVHFHSVLPDVAPIGSADDITIEEPPCGVVGAIPDSATIVSDELYDIVGDGTADDRLVSYLDGSWTLRAEVAGLVSEIPIDGVGPGSVEVLGLADVGSINAGTEFLATTGAGASTVEVGVFGFAGAGCLLQYRWEDGDAAEFHVGGSVTHGDATWCGEGYIGATGYEQDDDATYFAWSAAFEETSVGVLSYMLSSDDFSEGLTYDELGPLGLDCFGLSL